MVANVYLIWIYTLSLCAGINFSQNFSDTVNLYTDLLNGYNSKIRPVSDYSNPITVGLDFYLVTFKEFDEVTGIFSVISVLDLSWNDHRLTWNPTSYGNITSITVPIEEIWKPYLLNTKQITIFEDLGLKNSIMRVFSSGLILWQPPGVFDTSCAVDVTNFPFDKQSCSFRFLSWGYTKEEVYLQPVFEKVSMLRYNENGLWDIIDTKINSEIYFSFQFVQITISFKRKPEFYVANMIMPILVIGLLNVAVFKLPAESGERIGYSMTALLSITMYISSVSADLPRTNRPNIALLSYLLLIYLTISSLIVACTICSLIYYNKPENEKLPTWARFLVRIARLFKREKTRSKVVTPIVEKEACEMDLDTNMTGEQTTKPKKVLFGTDTNSDITWKDVANTVDNFFCFVYFICIVVANTVYFATVLKQ